jgi:hypothetical protein
LVVAPPALCFWSGRELHMEKAFWQDIIASEYVVPPGNTITTLTPELLAYLGATDRALRDEIAYPVLDAWIYGGRYTPDELLAMAARMVANLHVGLGEVDADSVFLRTFSALILAALAGYENERHFADERDVRRWLDAGLEYLAAERDLRGYVAVKGWAHSAAHTADLLRMLAKSRYLRAAELERILDAIAVKVSTPVAHVYLYQEDERLAYAVRIALGRNLLGLTFLRAWLGRMTQPEGWRDAYTDEAAVSACHNVTTFLRSLYFQLTFAPNPPAVVPELMPLIGEALKRLDIGFYKRA